MASVCVPFEIVQSIRFIGLDRPQLSVITPGNDWTIEPVGSHHATMRRFIVNHCTLSLLFDYPWPLESCGAPVLRQLRVQDSSDGKTIRFPECLSFTERILEKEFACIINLVSLVSQLRNETTMKTKTIGEKVDQVATVVETGSSLVGMMGFETPFLRLKLSDGRVVKWQSENVSRANMREGNVCFVQAYLYDQNMRRVTVKKIS